jgi:putative transcriptional regulator
MINHHPKIELLMQHVNGELPASISAGIKIHSDFCQQCSKQIEELTKHQAELSFEQTLTDNAEYDIEHDVDAKTMLDNIMQMEPDFEPEVRLDNAPISVSFRGVEYTLPNVMKKMTLGKPLQIGKLSRSRILLDEGHIRSSLLRIEAGGTIPEHTHNGYEITLLLEGSFKDEMGEYFAGDFIVLDKNHQHQPISEQGCLCYTVVSDSLHFTQGINKLLNPIGSFIY